MHITYFLKSLSTVPLGALILIGTTSATQAEAPSPRAAIEARQAGYKKMGDAMKAIRAQLQSASPNAEVMVLAAQAIAETAPKQASLFPVGSGSESGIQTGALPNIWTDHATFDSKATDLINESNKLLMVTKTGDSAAIAAQIKATGAACGGCHHLFRAET